MRLLRYLLVGYIALAFAYLLFHAREPLRFNVGDPWSDANVLSSIKYVKAYGFLTTSFTDILDVGPLTANSYRYTHYPPFAEIFYGSVGRYLGVSDIGTFRLFAIAFSGLAMWLFFSYGRRMYDARVALIATALFATSLLWLMYADSIHQAPIMQASAFLALWGLVRALETRQRRHYVAAALGSFLCFFTSYDYWTFLPVAVLITIYWKLGNPFARGNRHFIVVCAAGCVLAIVAKSLAVIGAVGWHEFVADLHMQFLERSSSKHDHKFTSLMPTLWRRLTLVFSPFAWVTAGYHVIKAIRAPSIAAALKETAVWMLLAAVAFMWTFSELVASQMLPVQVLLPFYALGSAIVIARLLDGRRLARVFAFAWLILAPAWAFAIMFSHPRSVLDRADVDHVNQYLAVHDRNDFMMSNLYSDGHIQAAFERHYMSAFNGDESQTALVDMLGVFERTGATYIHAAIFTTPDSRFIDKSLWPFAQSRGQWSVTGWPFLFRNKTNAMIRALDKNVLDSFARVGATKVLELDNFDLYRVDRAAVVERLERAVPVTREIDFGSLAARKFEGLGWGFPGTTEPEGVPISYVTGFERCSLPPSSTSPTEVSTNVCKTTLTKLGLMIKQEQHRRSAQILLRIEHPCDLHLTFTFGAPSRSKITLGGFSATQDLVERTAAFVVPASHVSPGVDVVELEDLQPEPKKGELPSLGVSRLEIQCD